jgi:hypothetical protein
MDSAMFSLNGSKPEPSERGLRWIWFGGSIISDWNKPIATTNRAVIRALQQRGHQVVYIEPSDSPAFMDALRARGSAIYRAFQEEYPDIHYRRESIPGGTEGDVWMSRETALADVLIVQDDAPAQIVDWLERIPPSPIVKVLVAQTDAPVAERASFDVALSPASDDPATYYGPAVLAESRVPGAAREGKLTVVYGTANPGVGAESSVDTVAAGAGAPDALPFVPEARLPERYRAVERVTIYDDDSSPFAQARAMLAVAGGAAVTAVYAGDDQRVVTEWRDANEQAERMIEQVMFVRGRRQQIKE